MTTTLPENIARKIRIPEVCNEIVSEMTLRDWFAGMASAGFISREAYISLTAIAKASYTLADAMMKAREEG